MAVKNTKTKDYTVACEEIRSILRSADFSKCLDANFIEEAILADGIEFRYIRKTDPLRYYGRNYFIKIKKLGENTTQVAITTQSRKVTVLVDTMWKKEVDKAFAFIDILLRK